MESKKIAVTRSTSLANRLSETGRGVRDWLKALEVPFDPTVDKLRLKKLEVKHGQCVYHYGIIRGNPTFAYEGERERPRMDADIFEVPFRYLENSLAAMA
jgi:hypothetical protein